MFMSLSRLTRISLLIFPLAFTCCATKEPIAHIYEPVDFEWEEDDELDDIPEADTGEEEAE